MTVSQKLRALTERFAADRYLTIDQARDKYGEDWPAKSGEAQSQLTAVLPELVAVVEAAEKARGEMFCPTCGYAVDNCPTACTSRDLHPALAALDEKLS